MRRKFIQKLERLKYCSSVCRKNHKHQIFQEKLKDTIKSNCSVCNKELINKREPCGKLVPRKMCDVCIKKQSSLGVHKMTDKFKYLYRNDIKFYQKMRRIHKKNGKKYKEKIEKFGLFPKWVEWYKKFDSFGKSKIEYKVADYIKSKGLEFQQCHQISNMFVDLYIPTKKLVIECQGTYWHMSPERYKDSDYNKITKRTAKEQWEKDKRRRLFMESNGYKVVELWESEINNGDYKKLDIYI
jgi:very-short-patch-repair endonuclease